MDYYTIKIQQNVSKLKKGRTDEIIESVHGSDRGGHFGVSKT